MRWSAFGQYGHSNYYNMQRGAPSLGYKVTVLLAAIAMLATATLVAATRPAQAETETGYLTLDGSTGTYVRTDSFSSGSGDLEFMFHAAADKWASGQRQTVLARWPRVAEDNTLRVDFNETGQLQLLVKDQGGADLAFTAPTAKLDLPDGEGRWFRIRLDADFAPGPMAQFWFSNAPADADPSQINWGPPVATETLADPAGGTLPNEAGIKGTALSEATGVAPTEAAVDPPEPTTTLPTVEKAGPEDMFVYDPAALAGLAGSHPDGISGMWMSRKNPGVAWHILDHDVNHHPSLMTVFAIHVEDQKLLWRGRFRKPQDISSWGDGEAIIGYRHNGVHYIEAFDNRGTSDPRTYRFVEPSLSRGQARVTVNAIPLERSVFPKNFKENVEGIWLDPQSGSLFGIQRKGTSSDDTPLNLFEVRNWASLADRATPTAIRYSRGGPIGRLAVITGDVVPGGMV